VAGEVDTRQAHGSDGFGSIRAPVACRGLVGLKPTRGRNTMAPYLGEGLGGFSTEHVLTRSVRASAALLDATAGLGDGDPYTAPPPARPFLQECGADPGRLHIAFTTATPNGAPVVAEYLQALQETVQLCAAPGHHVGEADPTIDRAMVIPTFLTLMAANTLGNLSSHPTAGRPARQDEVETVSFSPFTVWFNLTGQPAIVVPLGQTTDGRPLSVQLVARYGDEATLFRLASQIETARPWYDRKPAL
jgi:amidase